MDWTQVPSVGWAFPTGMGPVALWDSQPHLKDGSVHRQNRPTSTSSRSAVSASLVGRLIFIDSHFSLSSVGHVY